MRFVNRDTVRIKSVRGESDWPRLHEGAADIIFHHMSGLGAQAMPQLLRMDKRGKRLFVTVNGAGKVVMLNIAQPDDPKVLSVMDLGLGSGPHYLSLTRD